MQWKAEILCGITLESWRDPGRFRSGCWCEYGGEGGEESANKSHLQDMGDFEGSETREILRSIGASDVEPIPYLIVEARSDAIK